MILTCPKCSREGTLDSLYNRPFSFFVFTVTHDKPPYACSLGSVFSKEPQ